MRWASLVPTWRSTRRLVPTPGRRYSHCVAGSVRTVEVSVALPWGREVEPDTGSLGRELRLLWLIEQVRQHHLSVGKASALAEMPRAAFMRTLGAHGVPVIDYDVEDLDRELETLGLG